MLHFLSNVIVAQTLIWYHLLGRCI